MSPHDFFSPYYWPPPRRRRKRREEHPDPFETLERLDKYRNDLVAQIAQQEKDKKANEKRPPSPIENILTTMQWFAIMVTFGYPLGYLWWAKILKPLYVQ